MSRRAMATWREMQLLRMQKEKEMREQMQNEMRKEERIWQKMDRKRGERYERDVMPTFIADAPRRDFFMK